MQLKAQITYRSSSLLFWWMLAFFLFPISSSARLYISEFMASNSTVLHDNDFYAYADWVEIYNENSVSADISGYYLTNDISNPGKWRFPEGTNIGAHEVLLVWTDGLNISLKSLHAGFKLDADGDELVLFSDSKALIDSVAFSAQHTDISLGRNNSSGPQWLYFGVPSPGVINSNDGISTITFAPKVTFSSSGGMKNAPLQLKLAAASGAIYYTTNCSAPTRESTPYSSPITVDATTVIRARTFKDGCIPGPIVTHTYLFNYSSDLPIFSIATDSVHLWDDSSGIYCKGVNGIHINEAWGREPGNFNQPWERPINIELFEARGAGCINQTAGISIQGQFARLMAQKPFSIYGRNGYSGAFNYQLFPEKPATAYKSFNLSPGGNDWVMTMINEGVINGVVAPAMDLDIQAYRPSAVFLNGFYWGLYNIREKINEDYLLQNYGFASSNVDMLEDIQTLIAGDSLSWILFRDTIAGLDMSDAANFSIIEKNVDINEFINYMLTEIYFANTDWPVYNIRFWRSRDDAGKWRWILCGIDLGFNFMPAEFNSLERIADSTTMTDVNIKTATILFRKSLENDSFRNRFIQLFSHHLSSTFAPDRVKKNIDSMKNNIMTEMPKQIERWGKSNDNDIQAIPSMEKWEQGIGVLVKFAESRPAVQRSHIARLFRLDSCVDLTIDLPQSDRGVISIYGTRLADSTMTERFFKNVPLTLTAVPQPGYAFGGWNGISDSGTITITLKNDTVLTPRFFQSLGTVLPDTISSPLTLTQEKSPYFLRSDCLVDSHAVLTCEPGVAIQCADEATLRVNGCLQFGGTAEKRITMSRYNAGAVSCWGAIVFEKTVAPSELKYVTISHASIGRFPDREKGAVTALNASISITGCVFADVPFPFYAERSKVMVDSSLFSSTRTGDQIHIVNSDSAKIMNSRFIGNGCLDADGIDFDNVRDAVVENNYLFNFNGDNDDGIDLGEGSRNITIRNNHIVHCFDKGISVGQGSTVHLSDNTISDCSKGIGIKDSGSSAVIINNNFCYNDTDVAVYEKNPGAGGGNAEISNCIFFETGSAPLYVDRYSTADVSFSVCTSGLLPGTGNSIADPLFGNPASGNYSIAASSPCRITTSSRPYPIIGTGKIYDTAQTATLIISEIHFAPRQGPDYEFIELYNPSEQSIDIGGYWLSRAVAFTFPASFPIGPHECVVVCRNGDLYKNKTGLAVTWSNGKLANEGESIILRDRLGYLVDYVSYDPSLFPQAKSDGVSIELFSPESDNANMSAWQYGCIDGSPGITKFGFFSSRALAQKSRYTFTQENAHAVLRFTLPEACFVHAALYNVKGSLVTRLLHETLGGGHAYSLTIPSRSLAQGMYLFSFRSEQYSFLRKISICNR